MWYYKEQAFEEAPAEYQGFVYEITDKSTGKKYIGKKFFWKPKILPKTKKRKRRVRTIAESDWKKYFGSSKEVQQLVEENGEDAFHREILRSYSFSKYSITCILSSFSWSSRSNRGNFFTVFQ